METGLVGRSIALVAESIMAGKYKQQFFPLHEYPPCISMI
jgi:hypothetical protein